jgi:hypothetical protein
MEKAVIATAFPKARSVARTLGVSQARANELVILMDRIATNGKVSRRTPTFSLRKKHQGHVAKKKKKK